MAKCLPAPAPAASTSCTPWANTYTYRSMTARSTRRTSCALVPDLILAGSPWGRHDQGQAQDGDPFYAATHLLTRAQVYALLDRAGLRTQTTRSSLYQPPNETLAAEPPGGCDDPGAGFVCWRAVPGMSSPRSG